MKPDYPKNNSKTKNFWETNYVIPETRQLLTTTHRAYNERKRGKPEEICRLDPAFAKHIQEHRNYTSHEIEIIEDILTAWERQDPETKIRQGFCLVGDNTRILTELGLYAVASSSQEPTKTPFHVWIHRDSRVHRKPLCNIDIDDPHFFPEGTPSPYSPYQAIQPHTGDPERASEIEIDPSPPITGVITGNHAFRRNENYSSQDMVWAYPNEAGNKKLLAWMNKQARKHKRDDPTIIIQDHEIHDVENTDRSKSTLDDFLIQEAFPNARVLYILTIGHHDYDRNDPESVGIDRQSSPKYRHMPSSKTTFTKRTPCFQELVQTGRFPLGKMSLKDQKDQNFHAGLREAQMLILEGSAQGRIVLRTPRVIHFKRKEIKLSTSMRALHDKSVRILLKVETMLSELVSQNSPQETKPIPPIALAWSYLVGSLQIEGLIPILEKDIQRGYLPVLHTIEKSDLFPDTPNDHIPLGSLGDKILHLAENWVNQHMQHEENQHDQHEIGRAAQALALLRRAIHEEGLFQSLNEKLVQYFPDQILLPQRNNNYREKNDKTDHRGDLPQHVQYPIPAEPKILLQAARGWRKPPMWNNHPDSDKHVLVYNQDPHQVTDTIKPCKHYIIGGTNQIEIRDFSEYDQPYRIPLPDQITIIHTDHPYEVHRMSELLQSILWRSVAYENWYLNRPRIEAVLSEDLTKTFPSSTSLAFSQAFPDPKTAQELFQDLALQESQQTNARQIYEEEIIVWPETRKYPNKNLLHNDPGQACLLGKIPLPGNPKRQEPIYIYVFNVRAPWTHGILRRGPKQTDDIAEDILRAQKDSNNPCSTNQDALSATNTWMAPSEDHPVQDIVRIITKSRPDPKEPRLYTRWDSQKEQLVLGLEKIFEVAVTANGYVPQDIQDIQEIPQNPLQGLEQALQGTGLEDLYRKTLIKQQNPTRREPAKTFTKADIQPVGSGIDPLLLANRANGMARNHTRTKKTKIPPWFLEGRPAETEQFPQGVRTTNLFLVGLTGTASPFHDYLPHRWYLSSISCREPEQVFTGVILSFNETIHFLRQAYAASRQETQERKKGTMVP